MPLSLAYELLETGRNVVLQADIRAVAGGAAPAVDVTPYSLTVNARPYFARLFFAHEVAAESAKVTFAERRLTVTIPKAAGTPASWGPVLVMDEATAIERGIPERITEWQAAFVARQREAATATARTASEVAVHGSMVADEAIRSHVEAVQQRERDEATVRRPAASFERSLHEAASLIILYFAPSKTS